MDVRVDSGPQDGTILVTWIPVTLNTNNPKVKKVMSINYCIDEISSRFFLFNFVRNPWAIFNFHNKLEKYLTFEIYLYNI